MNLLLIRTCGAIVLLRLAVRFAAADSDASGRKLLYFAAQRIRDCLEYGGHGLPVFDIQIFEANSDYGNGREEQVRRAMTGTSAMISETEKPGADVL
jgi:hypothetical protein